MRSVLRIKGLRNLGKKQKHKAVEAAGGALVYLRELSLPALLARNRPRITSILTIGCPPFSSPDLEEKLRPNVFLSFGGNQPTASLPCPACVLLLTLSFHTRLGGGEVEMFLMRHMHRRATSSYQNECRSKTCW